MRTTTTFMLYGCFFCVSASRPQTVMFHWNGDGLWYHAGPLIFSRTQPCRTNKCRTQTRVPYHCNLCSVSFPGNRPLQLIPLPCSRTMTANFFIICGCYSSSLYAKQIKKKEINKYQKKRNGKRKLRKENVLETAKNKRKKKKKKHVVVAFFSSSQTQHQLCFHHQKI